MPILLTEKQLWYLVDLIAVEAAQAGETEKSYAACQLLRFLQQPDPGECAAFHAEGYTVLSSSPLPLPPA